jgi:hypothetical protein
MNEWKRGIFGMILTGRTKVLGEIPVGISFYPKKNSIWTGLGWNPDFLDERLAAGCLGNSVD